MFINKYKMRFYIYLHKKLKIKCFKIVGSNNETITEMTRIDKQKQQAIQNIQEESNLKLDQLKIKYTTAEKVKTGTSWIAIAMLITFSIITIAFDLNRFFGFLRKLKKRRTNQVHVISQVVDNSPPVHSRINWKVNDIIEFDRKVFKLELKLRQERAKHNQNPIKNLLK